MRRRFIHQVTLIVATMSLTLGLAPQMALCVGPSGHRAIEPMYADCCQHVPAMGDHTTAKRCSDECTDIPLGGQSLLVARTTVDHDRISSLPLISTAVIVTGALTLPASALSANSVCPPERPPRALHTTVILC